MNIESKSDLIGAVVFAVLMIPIVFLLQFKR